MNKLQFAAFLIIVGCSIDLIQAQRGTFEFYDSNGQCWRCSPGVPCERCTALPVAGPIPWPTECRAPDCMELIRQGNHLSTIFPAVDSSKFYQCAPDPNNPSNWIAIELTCPCDTLFSYENQRCDWPWEWIPHCTNLKIPVIPTPCPGPDDIEPSPVPTDPTTTTTTDVSTTTTTPSSCVCIPWWPCWCNPCWSMPCHSCSGCGMG